MQLDFTGLNNIAQKIAIKDFEEDPVEATESPIEDANKEERVEISLDALKGLTGANTEPQKQVDGVALINLTRQQQDHNKTLEVYGEYQTNIKRAGELRADILKGVKAGVPVHTLLLKAVECISNMTGDKLFYRLIEKDLKAIYGEAFLDDIPLEWELAEVEERLEKMKEALARETNSLDSKQRIETAIREHEAQVTTLKGLLERASKTELKKGYIE